MTTFERKGASCAALAFILLTACGGNVSLGGKGSARSGSGDAGGAPPVPTDQDPSRSQPVTTLPRDFSLGTLAVGGDYLYFSGVGAKGGGELHRCSKADCDAQRELLTSVSGTIGSLQVFGGRLGVSNHIGGSSWLGSYALPLANDRRVAIADLPTHVPVASRFLENFVYFSLGVDSGIYRCAMPDCQSGPQRIGSAEVAPGQVQLSVDGELVFWTDRSLIYRAADYGRDPARTLLADAELSDAPTGAVTPEAGLADSVEAMTAGDGALYAALKDSETEAPCNPACGVRMVRWPSNGGPREVLFSGDALIQRIFLFGEELAWVALDQPANYTTATLSSCRVEACEATRRDLGKVAPNMHAVVADDTDLYWLRADVDAGVDVSGAYVPEHQIRRAPRLPPP